DVPQQGRPDKKEYSVAGPGRDALAAWLHEPIDPANPPAAPLPPERPTALEEPAVGPGPYDQGPFARERHVWLGLHAAATRSLAQGSMIILS
ncbi:hypothetical protein ABZ054_29860, partial [Streptomyces sp. NPDC006324]